MPDPTPPSLRDTARRAMRAELLRVAEALLHEDGPLGLSTRRIAERAGTSTTAIYALFGGKDGLTEALYRAGFDALLAALAQVPEAHGAPRILALNRAYRRFALARPARYAVMFDRSVPGFTPSPAALTHARASLAPLLDAIERAAAGGDLRVTSPHDAALRLWTATHGLVILELSGHLPPDEAPGMLDRTVLDLLRAWGPPEAPTP